MHIRTLIVSCAGLLLSVPAIQADDILQVVNAASNVDWNNSSIWGQTPVSSNNYFTQSGLSSSATDFSVNGTTWSSTGTLRDSTGTSTFGGGSLYLESGTRLLSKVQNGTSTANIVLDGGYITWAPNGVGTSTLAGTITDNAALSTIGMQPTDVGTFNLASTLLGSGTIQLVIYGGVTRTNNGVTATRVGTYNVTGDLSAFTGTLYLSVADDGTGSGSSFSIADGTLASFATLELATNTTNFKFNLDTSNLTFGSLIVDGQSLAAGTYSVDDLNNIALASGAFIGTTGTITVVPEPSTTFLGTVGLLALLIIIRTRRVRA